MNRFLSASSLLSTNASTVTIELSYEGLSALSYNSC